METSDFLSPRQFYLERYIIIQKFLTTTNGYLYKAYDTKIDIPVCIKIVKIKPKIPDLQSDFIDVLQENQIENIIRIIDLFFDEGFERFVIISELTNNKKDFFIRNEKLTEKQALDIMKQVVKSFQKLKECGIDHDDFSMKKLLFNNQQVKLNFSHTQIINSEYDLERNPDKNEIYTQLQDYCQKNPSICYDLWAVGLVFFHFLVGGYFSSIENCTGEIEEMFERFDDISLQSQELIKQIFANKITWDEMFVNELFLDNEPNKADELLIAKNGDLLNENYQLKMVIEIQQQFGVMFQYDYGEKILGDVFIKKENFQINHDKVLGQGGFGIVYQGTFQDEQVAVKVMDVTFEEAKTILDEIITMVKCVSPFLVKLYGISLGDVKNNTITVYILMELMQKDLKGIIFVEKIKLNKQQKTQICKDVLEGLKRLNEGGFVHCDLKLQNVLTTQNLQAKITDFGLSKSLQHGQTKKTINITGFSERYTPKEYLSENIISPKCDVWAFGIMIYEIFKERQAWQGLNGPQVMAKVLSDTPFYSYNDKIGDQAIDGIIERCLHSDFQQRLSVQDLLEMFKYV